MKEIARIECASPAHQRPVRRQTSHKKLISKKRMEALQSIGIMGLILRQFLPSQSEQGAKEAGSDIRQDKRKAARKMKIGDAE
jgi:hypothetical protein